MIPSLCKSLRKLRVALALIITLPLLALALSAAPASPWARSDIPAHTQRTVIICLIGSICVDVIVNVSV